jgi:hypothetical protein
MQPINQPNAVSSAKALCHFDRSGAKASVVEKPAFWLAICPEENYALVASIWQTRFTVSRWLSFSVRNSNP